MYNIDMLLGATSADYAKIYLIHMERALCMSPALVKVDVSWSGHSVIKYIYIKKKKKKNSDPNYSIYITYLSIDI